MDALVHEAMKSVVAAVSHIDDAISPSSKREYIAKAINTVDALKAALKAL